MDNYQQYLIKSLRITTLSAKKPQPNSGNRASKSIYDYTQGAKDFYFKNGTITITQNDNYHLHQYELTITHPKLEKVWCFQQGSELDGRIVDDSTQKITIDFDNKVPSIFISFKNDLADPIELNIDYIDADKAAWDAKIAEENKKHLAEIVNIKITFGDSLVNVLFNPLTEKYSYCVITLFMVIQEKEKNNKTYQLMGDFKSEKGLFFIPIANLGYASYAITLKQYDESDNLIYESDRIDFSLSPQSKVVYNSRPTNIIR